MAASDSSIMSPSQSGVDGAMNPMNQLHRLEAAVKACLMSLHQPDSLDTAAEQLRSDVQEKVRAIVEEAKSLEEYFLGILLEAEQSPSKKLHQANEKLRTELVAKNKLLADQRKLLTIWRQKLATLADKQRGVLT